MPSKTDSSNKQRMNMDEHACNKNRSLRLPVLGDALRPSPQALVKRKGDGGSLNISQSSADHPVAIEIAALIKQETLVGDYLEDEDIANAEGAEVVADHSPMCVEMNIIVAVEMSTVPFKTFKFDGILGLSLDGLAMNRNFSTFDMPDAARLHQELEVSVFGNGKHQPAGEGRVQSHGEPRSSAGLRSGCRGLRRAGTGDGNWERCLPSPASGGSWSLAGDAQLRHVQVRVPGGPGFTAKDLSLFQRHEWEKHGRCAGVDDADDFFRQVCALAEGPLQVMDGARASGLDLVDTASQLQRAGYCVFEFGTQKQLQLSACKDQSGRWHLADVRRFYAVCGKGDVRPPSGGGGGHCVSGQRGPSCNRDSDCFGYSGCLRCAGSGHCTDVPLRSLGSFRNATTLLESSTAPISRVEDIPLVQVTAACAILLQRLLFLCTAGRRGKAAWSRIRALSWAFPGGAALTLVRNGMARQPHFGVFLTDNEDVEPSEVAFGGADSRRMLEPVSWSEVYMPELGYWIVPILAVRVGGVELDFCKDGTCRGVVDTGTSHLGVPGPYDKELSQMLQVDAGDLLDCRLAKSPNVEIDLPGKTIELLPASYMRRLPLREGVSVSSEKGVTVEDETDKRKKNTKAKAALRPGYHIVHVGPNKNHTAGSTKCIRPVHAVKCHPEAANKRSDIYTDKFTVSSKGEDICVERVDQPGSWGLDLEFLCPNPHTAGLEGPQQKGAEAIYVGRQDGTEKCVQPFAEVTCEDTEQFRVRKKDNQICVTPRNNPSEIEEADLVLRCKEVVHPGFENME
ncbi:Pgc, partial [Symbiodinium microadriaticum]